MNLQKAVSRIKIDETKCYYKNHRENICYVEESGKVPFIKFKPLDNYDFVNLSFSTKLGGVSKGYFESLNFSFDRGDERKNVCENYKRACESLGADYRNLILSDQVHSDHVEYVDERYTAGEHIDKKLKDTDGIFTDKKGLILATSYADCVPMFFVDVGKKVIAASHSGWRGTVLHIGEKTVAKMCDMFGSRKEDIICIVGPSICQECYEVSEDVIDEVKKSYPEDTWSDIFYQKNEAEKIRDGKYQLDLWAANYHQMKLAGLLEQNIYVSGLCTCCNSEVLYSHRATNGKRGVLNGFMYLKKDV